MNSVLEFFKKYWMWLIIPFIGIVVLAWKFKDQVKAFFTKSHVGSFAGYATQQISPQEETPRGIRNNNPLNIRISDSPWQGKLENNTDGEFEQFEEMVLGVRAAIKLLRNYRDLYDAYTIQDIIGKWAPSTENDTDAYISNISVKMMAEAETVLPDDEDTYVQLAYHMSRFENGGYFVPYATFKEAYKLL